MNNVYLKFGWCPNNKECCCTSPDAENTIYFPQSITEYTHIHKISYSVFVRQTVYTGICHEEQSVAF